MIAPGQTSLDLSDLTKLLQTVDPRVILVPERLLRRVIKQNHNLPGWGLRVPHRKSYFLGREQLLSIVDRLELNLEKDRELPGTVILLVQPQPEKLALLTRNQILLQYWRLLFHCHIHLALAQRFADHRLTEAAIRERIHRIGQIEFDEIRRVLRQENLLLSPRDNRMVYEEFAALFLELNFFAPPLLSRHFPTMANFTRIDTLLAEDVDAQEIFARTRPPGITDPVLQDDGPGPEEKILPSQAPPLPLPPEQSRQLLDRAEKAALVGNLVGAALRKAQALRGFPSEILDRTRPEIDHLVDRLQKALHLNEKEAANWKLFLPSLLTPAAHGLWPVEARLLYDLQKVCVAHERTIYIPNLLGWFTSLFRKPLLDPLPHQQAVLMVKHLRRATGRLPSARLSEVDRQALSVLLHGALHHQEEKLRERFRPLVESALEEVGLTSKNVPEQTALHKVIEELLDRIVERGLLTLGDLRDALSRNQLKLPDLAGPGEFFRGDALLRANRRLADQVKGVYRFGEFYLRWLQRFSSLAFGTRLGRVLTLFIAIPFAGAFVFLEGLQHLVKEVLHLVGLHAIPFVNAEMIVALAVFLFGVIHVRLFRSLVVQSMHLGGKSLRWLILDMPGLVIRLPLVQFVVTSPAFRWLIHYLVKPALITLPVGYVLQKSGQDFFSVTLVSGLTFVVACLFLNSRLGRDFQERTADWLAQTWEWLRDFFLGLFRLIQEIFKSFLEAVDRALYTVDEWLRFRSGEGRLTLVAKVILAPLWGAIAYVVRFVLLLFVEPQINPIKHFPVVTVAHKLLLPLTPLLAGVLQDSFHLEQALAGTLALILIGKIPGVFGFLVWELKENWRLYKANRPLFLRPVLIGHHGETMVRFMKLGFHSGTLPRLHHKLRKAERRAHSTGDWRPPQKIREALHHAEESIQHFVEREFVYLLQQSSAWNIPSLFVSRVEAGSNRVRVTLACPELGTDSLEVAFEEQAGWLLAGIASPGWLSQLPSPQQKVLQTALAGLYKLAGVDLVREQLHATLACPYDVMETGLVAWPGPTYEMEALYDLHQEPTVLPQIIGEKTPASLPTLDPTHILFRNLEIPWVSWVEAWEKQQPILPNWLHLLPRKSIPVYV